MTDLGIAVTSERVNLLLLLQPSFHMARFKFLNIISTHDGACPTNGGSVIKDQRVGTIQFLFQSDPLHMLKMCSFSAL